MRILVIVAIASILCAARIGNAQEKMPEVIKSVVLENLKATQAEDTNRTMITVHTQSPIYRQTKQMLAPIFDDFDLSYELLSFSYIGLNGEYAVARVKQTTKKVSGPIFQENEMDMVQVFRKENGKWKFWTQAILEIKYTNN